jgi:membrane-associated phospholipid phosphatase
MKRTNFLFHIAPALVALVLAASLNALGSIFIEWHFPDRPVIPDLLFQLLPYTNTPWVQGFTDVANIASMLLVIWYIGSYFTAKDRMKMAIEAVYSFAFAYAMRAFLIVLNPFGTPLPPTESSYGLTTIPQHGQFPSGHTIMVVVAYMLIRSEKSVLVKVLAGLMVAVEVFCLLFSQGHYSIDIAGSFLVAYVAVHEVRRWSANNEK